MQFALFIPHAPPPVVSELVGIADKAGFFGLCTDDHLISPFADMTPDFQGCYESFTMMSFLAGQTRKVRLTHMALVAAFRGPCLLAKMSATLDQLSGGRFILAIGAGWNRREFEAYGIPFENHNERIRREAEIIRIIRALWTQDELDFEGEFYSFKGVSIHPLPLQKPHPPIWVGGDSKPSQLLAATEGDGWLMHGHSPLETEKLIKRVEPRLARPRDQFTMANACFVLLGRDKAQAEAKLERIPKNTWNDFQKARIRDEIRNRISGTVEDCIRRIREFESAGLQHMDLVFLDPEDLRAFIDRVMPEFN